MNKKIISIYIVLIISLTSIPFVSSNQVEKDNYFNVKLSGINQEINLLKGEFYLYLNSTDNVSKFNVKYAFPPEYKYQHPVYLEILEDSTANITNYQIEEQSNEPNNIINFSIGPMKNNQQVLIHFNVWLLIESYNYEDLPEYIQIPEKIELPNQTKIWLDATEVVQKDNFLIKIRAWQLKLFTKNNILKLADRVAHFTKYHRYLVFLLQYNLQKYLQYPPQDALTTLLFNGECPGRSHLGCALFRANNVPARVVLAMPTRYDFWFEMHYMSEYFCPDYNWILTEVHGGITPYGPQNQIILRICYPEDENNTQADFIYPRMKGIERWIWLDNEFVKPYYVDCKQGSKIRAFNEKILNVDWAIANETIDLTKEVFDKYQSYLGQELNGENLNHFNNAISYQMEAVNGLAGNEHELGYYYINLENANEEYNLISV